MIRIGSDTETMPCPAMRKVMYEAKVGDEQKGTDPSVNLLLEKVAFMLGQEKALFLPTGTMCNLIAIKAHTNPFETILAESMSHIVRAEGGGVAMSSGILIEQINSERGIFTADQMKESLDHVQTSRRPYAPLPSLVCIEQSHNFKGGCVWTLNEMQSIAEVARDRRLKIHVDGARLFNASRASKIEASKFGKIADSIWIDFTKGLGAPLGAALAGSEAFIERCRIIKHAFGGAMRQAGIVAAACSYALEHNIENLDMDHKHARWFASQLAAIKGIEVRNPRPETNIVFFRPTGDLSKMEKLKAGMLEDNISIGSVGPFLRAVTHLDISRNDLSTVIQSIKDRMDCLES